MFHLTTALDAASAVPLYEQLYQSLAAEMRAGAIPAGTRMPGKRRLAAELSVSDNTVDAAYQILAAEGYLERSGFYVQEYLALPPRPERAPGTPAKPMEPEAPAGEAAPPSPPVRYDLSTRGVDPALFPFRTWARLQKELLYSSPELLTHGDAQGDWELRQALADYLEEYRGVQCSPQQIVVGAGLEYLLGLLAPLLPGKAAVETPGYPRAKQVLENNGVECCCLPVDEDGLSIEELSRSGASVCYVTPSHQFPTGVTMPAGRRAELLHWAAKRPGERYIIEDDYDSEFRFDTRPLPSLQGMAGADGPVVYLSTCSRSLAPSIRIAYMVLPEHLLPAWWKTYRLYASTVGRFEQQTLARFITEGYFTRHLARERVAYKARRDALTAALNAAFAPGQLRLAGLHTGLHLLASLKNAPPDEALRQAAEAEGVRLNLLSDYDLTGARHQTGTLVLGYGSLDDAACASVGQTLKRVCTEAREASVNPEKRRVGFHAPGSASAKTAALPLARNSSVLSSVKTSCAVRSVSSSELWARRAAGRVVGSSSRSCRKNASHTAARAAARWLGGRVPSLSHPEKRLSASRAERACTPPERPHWTSSSAVSAPEKPTRSIPYRSAMAARTLGERAR